jgi:hypothetical protein
VVEAADDGDAGHTLASLAGSGSGRWSAEAPKLLDEDVQMGDVGSKRRATRWPSMNGTSLDIEAQLMDFLDELNDGGSSGTTGTERIWRRRRGRMARV